MYVYNWCKKICIHLMRNCEKEAAWYCSRARPLIAAAPVCLVVFVGESERARGRARKREVEREREREREQEREQERERDWKRAGEKETEVARDCSKERPLIAAAPVCLVVFVGESERARGRARKRARERAREWKRERKRLKKGGREGKGRMGWLRLVGSLKL